MTSVSGSGERILAILALFSEARPEWRTEEMQAALGYSRPTLYRYIKTLKDAGYLVSLSQASYTLGPRVTELDFLMRRSDPLIPLTAPHLAALAEAGAGSAFVLRFYGNRLLCIASESRADPPRSSYPRGRPMPLGRGAGSRAIAAFLPARERRALVEEYLDAFATPRIGDSVEAVLEELRRVRRDRVAVATGEVTPGLTGIASPLLAEDETLAGALCLSTETRGLDAARLARLTEAVRARAAEVSAALVPDRMRHSA